MSSIKERWGLSIRWFSLLVKRSPQKTQVLTTVDRFDEQSNITLPSIPAEAKALNFHCGGRLHVIETIEQIVMHFSAINSCRNQSAWIISVHPTTFRTLSSIRQFYHELEVFQSRSSHPTAYATTFGSPYYFLKECQQFVNCAVKNSIRLMRLPSTLWDRKILVQAVSRLMVHRTQL